MSSPNSEADVNTHVAAAAGNPNKYDAAATDSGDADVSYDVAGPPLQVYTVLNVDKFFERRNGQPAGQKKTWRESVKRYVEGSELDLGSLDSGRLQLQESMFELLTSEASYFKSLDLIVRGLFQKAEFVAAVNERDRRLLISNLEQIRDLSKAYALLFLTSGNPMD